MRAQVLLRPALEADAPALVDVWADVLRRANREQQLEDVRQVIDRVAVLPGERLTVAEVDGAAVEDVDAREVPGDDVVGREERRAVAHDCPSASVVPVTRCRAARCVPR